MVILEMLKLTNPKYGNSMEKMYRNRNTHLEFGQPWDLGQPLHIRLLGNDVNQLGVTGQQLVVPQRGKRFSLKLSKKHLQILPGNYRIQRKLKKKRKLMDKIF